eukprot:CAMPEP_0198612924 /NCGR_PEP_ID=MMETSP1462-20131121/158135_1 /TAXON_ID=1333877 /ORGANISM="Brandtodinium nutriculum, Strain RCC3387" /LENGTH=149 /DNA_ID=CAMNT_0044344723 /DNA_START=1141 /DNA_END=1591 /DNA_ORIENTATION=+
MVSASALASPSHAQYHLPLAQGRCAVWAGIEAPHDTIPRVRHQHRAIRRNKQPLRVEKKSSLNKLFARTPTGGHDVTLQSKSMECPVSKTINLLLNTATRFGLIIGGLSFNVSTANNDGAPCTKAARKGNMLRSAFDVVRLPANLSQTA